jgi:hypothetical protein
MNWNPFRSVTLLESRVKSLEDQVLDLHMRLSEDAKSKKALDVLRKARQRDYGRRYYEKRKAEKAAKGQA